MKWYKGPTLLEALKAIKIPNETKDERLKMLISRVESIKTVRSTTVYGRIISGHIKPGLIVCVAGAAKPALMVIKSLKLNK